MRRNSTGLEVGNQVELANNLWTVVGTFASGDAHDSELWADSETVANTYRLTAFQSVTAKLAGKDGFAQLKAAMAADPRLKLDVDTTQHYYSRQSENLTQFLKILGIVIGTIMAIGAVFGALNTMYAAVAGRAREIATMRAIGFRGLPVVVAVILETMLLALLGGVIGGAIAWIVFNGYTAATLGSNFSQVMFQFKVSPELLWNGPQVGARHRPGRRAVPGAACGETAGDRGLARCLIKRHGFRTRRYRPQPRTRQLRSRS